MEKKGKLRKELGEVKHFLHKQMLEKKAQEMQVKLKEQDEYNKLVNKLAVFPRIVEPDKELQIRKQRHMQDQVKKDLQQQMLDNENKRKLERQRGLAEERERISKFLEKKQKEDEDTKSVEKEKRDRYCEDLKQNVECKEKVRVTQKKLESLKVEDLDVMENGVENVVQDDNKTEEGKEVDVGVIEDYFRGDKEQNNLEREDGKVEEHEPVVRDEKMDKMAMLIEKKQRKANELLMRIEELQKTESKAGSQAGHSHRKSLPLSKLRAAVSPQAYTFMKDGKKIRIEPELSPLKNVNFPKSPQPSSQKSPGGEKPFSPYASARGFYEKTQRMAFNQYLSKLETQVAFLLSIFVGK